jgi:hypothetical protein
MIPCRAVENQLRVLFLTKYPRQGPSSRYRVYQFIPYLEREGFTCTVQSLHVPGYLESLFDERWQSVFYHFGRLLKRVAAAVAASRYQVVFIQKELLPYVPPILEYFIYHSGVPVIYDLDDAIFLRYTESRNPIVRLLLGRKIPGVLKRSTVVLAGNAFLKRYASRYSFGAVLFPTVIDTARYNPSPRYSTGGMAPMQENFPVIGWIGSPGTVRYVAERGEILRRLAGKVRFTLRVIGAPRFGIPGVHVEAVPWSEEHEAGELQKCDIGIMPLPDTMWSRGKCGLKLLQYMAAGLPVVTSPYGGASDIVTHGVHGFIARTDDEWVEHILALLGDPALCIRLGRAGRRRVEDDFSLERWAPRLAGIMRRAAAGGTTNGRVTP